MRTIKVKINGWCTDFGKMRRQNDMMDEIMRVFDIKYIFFKCKILSEAQLKK